jgi:hypothetical protein
MNGFLFKVVVRFGFDFNLHDKVKKWSFVANEWFFDGNVAISDCEEDERKMKMALKIRRGKKLLW